MRSGVAGVEPWRSYMEDGPLVAEMVFASASMDVARDATERGDWSKAEQALLDVQDRIGRLLRELTLKAASETREASPTMAKAG
jgi:hypothetical protein